MHGKSKGHEDSHMQPKEKARQLKVEAMQQKVKKSYDQEGGSLLGRGGLLSYRSEEP